MKLAYLFICVYLVFTGWGADSLINSEAMPKTTGACLRRGREGGREG
jgi:hypothetical protein